MVVCIFPTSRVRGPRFTVQGPRCCGSATMTSARHLNKCVRTLENVCALHNPIRAHTIVNVINDLRKCVRCVRCVQAFSSSFTHLNALLILSSKSNFDQNKCAHTAHISESRMVADFLLFQSAHTFAHTLRTHPLLSAHIPNHRSLCPLTTSNEPRFALHAHRSVSVVNWLILTDSLLVVVLFCRRN
jgi:hypothetical protein